MEGWGLLLDLSALLSHPRRLQNGAISGISKFRLAYNLCGQVPSVTHESQSGRKPYFMCEHLVFHNFRYIFIGSFHLFRFLAGSVLLFCCLGLEGSSTSFVFFSFFSTRQPRSTSLPSDRGCQTEPWQHSAFEDGFGQMIMLFCMVVSKRLLALFENWYMVFSENHAWHVSSH